MNKIIERVLILGALAVVLVIVVDALAAIPLREWDFMACHVKGGHWLCAFDWRRMVAVVCQTGLTLISIIFVCNAKHLRTMNRRTVMTVTAREWPTCHIQYV